MNNQIKFLIALGAYENSILEEHKVGIISNMLSMHKNERLWLEAAMPISFQKTVAITINELQKYIIELAVDGTVFPKEVESFTDKFSEIIYECCEEIELDISFDGYSYEEAKEIAQNKEKFIKMLKNNQLEYSHLAYDEDKRVCILTIDQIEKLAILSVDLDIFRYFDDFDSCHIL